MPSGAALPQNVKSPEPALDNSSGQRHLPRSRSRSEQGCALSTLAALAVFLASDAGKSISGQVLPIDNDRYQA